MQKEFLVGIDEVGRGALAGPVVVTAVLVSCVPSQIISRSTAHLLRLGTLKDSKKLSAKQREAWYAYFLKHPNISFAVARVYPRQIEKQNISGAANLAASRAFLHLRKRTLKDKKMTGKTLEATAVFLDGGLFLRGRAWQQKYRPSAQTIIKADEKIPAVSVASIIAKVHRDRLMKKIAKQYPQYQFEVNKGYGTKIHRESIKKFGPCEIHRKTFLARII